MMTTKAPFTSLRLVQLDHLIENATEEAYKDLQNIASSLPNQTDDAKKRALLQHLNATKQRLLRLQVLLQWCHKASAVAECKRVLEVSSTHASAFREAADQLVYLHGELVYSKAPAYDIPTAIHVLRSGGYSALPTLIESELKVVAPGKKGKNSANPITTAEKEVTTTPEQIERGNAALRRLDFLIRSKLLEEGVPYGMRIERISNGEAVVSSTTQQYTAIISLVPAPNTEVTLAKWTPPEEGTALRGVPTDQEKAEEQEIVQPIKQEENLDGDDGGKKNEEKIKVEAMDIDAENNVIDNNNNRDASIDTKKAVVSSEASLWRWRLLSFKLLPTHPSALLPPHLVPWLIRNVEDRMWAASDIQQLINLGKSDLVVVPAPPLTRKQKEKKQKEMDERGRDAVVPLSVGGVSAQPSKSSGSLRDGVSGAGAMSGGGGSEQVGLATGASDGTTAADGKEAGEPGVIPIWAQSPLAALHAVLQHTSAKLAIGSVLMEQARALENGTGSGSASAAGLGAGGAWSNGNLRISKIDDRFGVKFSLWPRVPLLSTFEITSMLLHEGQQQLESKEETQEGKVKKERKNKEEEERKYPSLGWALHVEVPPPSYEDKTKTEKSLEEKVGSTSDGTITCVCVPPLRRFTSWKSSTVSSPSVWSEDGSLSTENLLLRASAQHAEVQLSAVQCLITQRRSISLSSSTEAQQAQHAQYLDEILGVDTWKAEVVNTQTSATKASYAMPALQCSFNNQAVLLLHFRLIDGQPIFSLGPILTESGVELASEGRNIINKAQFALNKRLEAVLTEVLPVGITRSLLWATTIYEAVVEVWKQIIALQRKEHVLLDALGYGFGRAVLPRCLEGAELDNSNIGGAPGGAAGGSGSGAVTDSSAFSTALLATKETTAVLRAPYFTSPLLPFTLKESIPMGKQGSLVCFILADVSSAAAVSSVENFAKQLKLALCWATPRGVPTGLRRLISVPIEVISNPSVDLLSNADGGSNGLKTKEKQPQELSKPKSDGNGNGKGTTSTKRKRHDIDNEGEKGEDIHKHSDYDTSAVTLAPSFDGSSTTSTEKFKNLLKAINWEQIKQWCLATIAVHQIEAQLEAADCKAEPTEDKTAVRVVLNKIPWLSSSSSSLFSSFFSFTDEEIQFSLDPGQTTITQPEEGAFLSTFIGEKFSIWKKEIQNHGLENLIHINGIGSAGAGELEEDSSRDDLVVRCCLKYGEWSAAHMVAKAACVGATAACAVNLATALKQQKEQQQEEGRYSVSIQSIDLGSIQLKHVDSGRNGSDSIETTVTIQWNASANKNADGGGGGGVGAAGAAGASSVRRLMTSYPTLNKQTETLSENKEERLAVRTGANNRPPCVCSVSSSPQLPLPLLSYLETQLFSIESGSESTQQFLSVLTSAAASAAVVQAAVLEPAAQHAAGLLPSAIQVENFSFGPAAENIVSAGTGALGVCRLLIHQLGRSLHLQIVFQSSGTVTLYARQLLPAPRQGEDTWLRDAWSRILAPENGVSADTNTDEWSHVTPSLLPEQLGPVLTRLMHSVSRRNLS